MSRYSSLDLENVASRPQGSGQIKMSTDQQRNFDRQEVSIIAFQLRVASDEIYFEDLLFAVRTALVLWRRKRETISVPECWFQQTLLF